MVFGALQAFNRHKSSVAPITVGMPPGFWIEVLDGLGALDGIVPHGYRGDAMLGCLQGCNDTKTMPHRH